MKDHRTEYLRQQHRGRREIGLTLCDMIERDRHRHPALIIRQTHTTRWRAGICSICGEYSSFVSQEHAHRHGFKDADEMAKSGVVKWTE